MPRRWRMGGFYMNGYMNGAKNGLEPKMSKTPMTNKRTMSGMSHHFFSCRRNSRNSLASRNMINRLYQLPRPLQIRFLRNSLPFLARFEQEHIINEQFGPALRTKTNFVRERHLRIKLEFNRRRRPDVRVQKWQFGRDLLIALAVRQRERHAR